MRPQGVQFSSHRGLRYFLCSTFVTPDYHIFHIFILSLKSTIISKFYSLDNISRRLITRSRSLQCVLSKPSRFVSVSEVLLLITCPWSIFILIIRVVIPEVWLRVRRSNPGISGITWWLRMDLGEMKCIELQAINRFFENLVNTSRLSQTP